MKKLKTQDIINHMTNGAILTKVYGVYSYWVLTTTDGDKIYNFIKGSPESAKSKINYELISNDKTGFSIKIK